MFNELKEFKDSIEKIISGTELIFEDVSLFAERNICINLVRYDTFSEEFKFKYSLMFHDTIGFVSVDIELEEENKYFEFRKKTLKDLSNIYNFIDEINELLI